MNFGFEANMKKKCKRLFIEVYDKRDGKAIRFVRVDDLQPKVRKLVYEANLISVFYQDGEIIAEDKHGNEYNISDDL